MRRKQALSLAAAAAVTAGVFASAWPAFASEAPLPAPVTTTSFPEPPHKPEPTGPYTPPTFLPPDPSITPPPMPTFECDPADIDCVPDPGSPPVASATPTTGLPLPPGHPIPSGPTTQSPLPADPSVSPPPMPTFPPDDPEDQ